MFFLENALTDRLEVKLAVLKLLVKSRPDYSTAALVSARKRKRNGLVLLRQPVIGEDVATVQEE